MVSKPSDFLTPAEVGRLFGVNPVTVSRWADEGKLTPVRTLGGHRRFRKEQIDQLLATTIPEETA